MSKPKSDGGPAFPHDNQELIDGHRIAQPGMTLRDYFAAAALPALVASALDLDHVKWDAAAEHAYTIADAMLKERSKP